MKKAKGYVYILTNPSFREDWVKIGKSARPVDLRLKELDNTAVPLPFEIYATLQTKKYAYVEGLIHQAIKEFGPDLVIRPNREFFNIKPEKALKHFRKIAEGIDDAVIKEYTKSPNIEPKPKPEPQPIPKPPSTKRPRFRFSMVGIKIGEYVTFIPTNIKVKVVADDLIEYKGKKYKLSPFVRKFLPKSQRNTSGAYQGAKYFSYKGETLYDLRIKAEMESNLDKPKPNPPNRPKHEQEDEKRTTTRKPFRFSMVGIKPGEFITFTPTNTKVKVATDELIEYDGETYRLSTFVKYFIPEDRRNASGAYRGPAYFTYNGKTLVELRAEAERSQNHTPDETAE